MNIKTSTKISLKFTFFTSLLLILFWLIVNLFYFYQWYEKGKARLEERGTIFDNIWFGRYYKNINPIKDIRQNALIARTLYENRIFLNISYINWNYILYSIINNRVYYSNITHYIYSQISLLMVSMYVIIFMMIIVYFVSFYFVKSSLKWLNLLVKQTKKIDLDNLNTYIKVKGPDDDEIKIVAESINNAMKKIDNQTRSLKDFISNASHELKTPLMEILAQADIIDDLETKRWIKHSILNMNKIVENLLLLSKLQSQNNFEKNKENISLIIYNISDRLSNLYSNKKIKLHINIEENIKIFTSNILFEILFKNILENAFKYTQENWNIYINLDNEKIEVKDDWLWIKKENLEKIWESFYQQDACRNDCQSYWLGLYIVKQIIQVLNFEIKLDSKEWEGSKFTIKFK